MAVIDDKKKNDAFERVVEGCRHILHSSPMASRAKDYIVDRIGNSAAIKYEFGFIPNSFYIPSIYDVVDKSDLKITGIISESSGDSGSVVTSRFEDSNLIFPYRDALGNIVTVIGRNIPTLESEPDFKDIIDESDSVYIPKRYVYLYGMNKSFYCYGLNYARDSIVEKDCVIVVEGQIDAISCYNHGILNVVSIGGSSLSRYQAYQLSKYTSNIYLMFDNDEAGIKGKRSAKDYYNDIDSIVVKSISLAKGFSDVDDFFRNEKDPGVVERFIRFLKSLGSYER